MRRAALVVLVAGAACSGPAKPPVVDLPRMIAPMRRPAPPLEPAMGPYGARDADGKADGEWLFDCDGVAQGCHAWFEHGTQVVWARAAGADRYVIEARDGIWRWQWWSGDVLRGEAGLATQPPRWTPGEIVEFSGYAPPPQGGPPCAGAFVIRDQNGARVSDGTCEHGQWTEWNTYDALGHPITINHRDDTGSDSQSLDGSGHVLSRVRVASDGAETTETWYPDGTPQTRYVARSGALVENKLWYAAGTPAEVDVTTGRDRVDRRYSPSGALVALATYRDGTPTGTWRSWYGTGVRRSSVTYRADGSPGPLTVWRRSGKKLATANLATRTWSDGSHHGSRIRTVRIADGADRVGINGNADCRATDEACLRALVDLLFSPVGCVESVSDDALAIWRGRIGLTLGFDRTGVAAVTAVRDADGLPQQTIDCLTGGAGAPERAFAQHVDLVVDIDSLTEPLPPQPLKPAMPDIADPMM